MYLKSLEINGFKSFGQKVNLDFKTKISSIVGPNGSGKSNIAEAFRFVLAEQSIKNMRGKKGEDLIFRGKNSHLNRASVKVKFDNSDKKLNIDYSEVSIERVIFKDGQNDYYINSNKVRAKDIIELLTSANVGSSGHHIISQGQADSILSITPKERKALIEEALGLKGYVLRKDQSIKKLEKTEQNLEDIKVKESINAPRIRFLKKEVEKIEKFKNLKSELKNLYISFFPEKNKIQKDIQKFKENISKENEYKKSLEEKIINKENELFSNKDKNNKTNSSSDKINSLYKENKDFNEQKQALQKLIAKNEYQIELEENKKNIFIQQKQKVKENQEYYNSNLNIVLEIIHRAWILWSKKLLETEKISEERTKKWKENFTSFSELNESWKNKNHNFAAEILEKFNITKEGGGLEKYNQELIDKLKLENLGIEKKINSILDQQESLETKINILSKNDSTSTQALNQEIEIEILKIKNIISEVNSKILLSENLKNKSEMELEKFKKEEVFATSFFGQEFLDKVENNLFKEENGEINILEKIIRTRILLENTNIINQIEITEEYNKLIETQNFIKKEVSDLEGTKIKLEKLIDDIKEQIEERFRLGVDKINKEFSVFFQTLFSGGNAEIKLVEIPIKNTVEDDNFDEVELGIEINVSLPNKKVSGLSMLSGGERSLTSIALLFAISSITPPPFIILDETDAALDEANSKRYADMIEKLAEHSQLILITHNRETMSRAGLLYGVTMNQDGISKLLSVSFEQAEKVAK